jgi:hypothetical protein
MTGIFDRLSFPDSLSSETIAYSDKTINTMNTMPKLLNDWQNEDIASSNVGGYFKNPVTTYTANLAAIAASIEAISAGILNIEAIYSTANSVLLAIPEFNDHTDRLSGVTAITPDTSTLPHYESAIGLGKVLSHLVYQSDGIANNAVMIGSFGSLYSTNTLQGFYDTISSYPSTIANSIFTNFESNSESNLTSTQISTIVGQLSNITSYMVTTSNADITFFTNSRSVVDDYNAIKGFTKMGQTEIYLTQNLVGSDKLLSRTT